MNLKLSAVGLALQDGQGVPAAQPEFYGPVGGGKLVTLEVEQNEDELTSAEVGGIGEFREGVAIAADYETRAWPESIGALLYAALGDVDSGTGPPYTHVITPDGRLPWATLFGTKDSDLKIAEDCKLDELKLEWEGNGPLKVTATWAGLDAAWSASAFVPVSDESLLDYFKGIHLAAVLDLDGAGYDGDAQVMGGSIDIKRNLEADIYSGNILPGDVFEGNLEVDVEVKVRVSDLLPVRALLTGSESGDAVTAAVPYGEFEFVFTDSPSVLTLAATRVAWRVPEEPEADPAGGPAELTLQGRCYGNPCLTATVVNTYESYEVSES